MDTSRLELLSRVLEESKKYIDNGSELPIEFQKILFPSGKKECELVYGGKETQEQILSKVMSVPLQEEKSFPSSFNTSEKEWTNKLIFGDNLQVLKTLIEYKKQGKLKNSDGSDGVKLIYIDPPFSTRRDFKASSEDQKAYADKLAGADFLEWLRKRLILLRELMSDNGSIYVHLDYRKYHYVKVLMDEIFGENCFKNDITWKYSTSGAYPNYYARNNDKILLYVKNNANYVFHQKRIFDKVDYAEKLLKGQNISEKNGEYVYYYNGEERTFNKQMTEVWVDIDKVKRDGKEKTGYPTQKPLALLSRIIETSSDIGDIVLDCFAGSGTSPIAAESLNRRWIAIDIGKLSIYTIQKRLLSLEKFSPFSVYTAGLYDESKLNKFDEYNWKIFAMQLWGCTPKRNLIKNFEFDGERYGDMVKVYSPHELKKINAKISIETLNSIYSRIGDSAGNNIFIIAPKGQFTFAEDEVEIGSVIFNILRIPYSMLARFTENFSAPIQPKDANSVNEAVDSAGFDFIQPPDVDFSIKSNYLIINKFKSNSRIRGEENSELSMILIDYNYDGETFDLDKVIYKKDLKENKYKIDDNKLKGKTMLIFVDNAGNEKKVVIDEGQNKC